MGTHTNIKLSFYFLLSEKVKVIKNSKIEYNCCKCKIKRSYKTSNYCGECGTEIIEKEVFLTPSYPLPDDFCEEYFIKDYNKGDCVVRGDYGYLPDNIWLYNYPTEKEITPYEYKDEDTSDATMSLDDLDIGKGIELFSKIPKVVDFISKFEEAYGAGSITIKYGLVKTAS